MPPAQEAASLKRKAENVNPRNTQRVPLLRFTFYQEVAWLGIPGRFVDYVGEKVKNFF
jgi:hypothetical protein